MKYYGAIFPSDDRATVYALRKTLKAAENDQKRVLQQFLLRARLAEITFLDVGDDGESCQVVLDVEGVA